MDFPQFVPVSLFFFILPPFFHPAIPIIQGLIKSHPKGKGGIVNDRFDFFSGMDTEKKGIRFFE